MTLANPSATKQMTVVDPLMSGVLNPYINFAQGYDQIITTASLNPGLFNVALTGASSAAFTGSNNIFYTGVKTDSVGQGVLPPGTDQFKSSQADFVDIVSTEGYKKTSTGLTYAIVEEFFTDRVSGEIHKRGIKTQLTGSFLSQLGRTGTIWAGAVNKGLINLSSRAPLTRDDAINTALETDVVIDVIRNDSDPDGDLLQVDGIVQPLHGLVFDNGNGTVTYRPDFDFVGTDTFRYWASDGQGNFSPAQVSVVVQ